MSSSDCIATVSVFIAFLALGLTIWQGCMMRRHNQLTVRPNISCRSSNKKENVLTLSLKNDGLGTAIIQSIIIAKQGDVLSFNSENIMGIVDLGNVSNSVVNVLDVGGQVSVGVGDTLELFEITCQSDIQFKRLLAVFENRELMVDYLCLYGNQFESKLIIR